MSCYEDLLEVGFGEIKKNGFSEHGNVLLKAAEPLDAVLDSREIATILDSKFPLRTFEKTVKDMYKETIDEDMSEIRHMVEDAIMTGTDSYTGECSDKYRAVDCVMSRVNIFAPFEHHKQQGVNLSELLRTLEDEFPFSVGLFALVSLLESSDKKFSVGDLINLCAS